MENSAYWRRTDESINRRRALREKILSETISELQGMYPRLEFGKTVTVNNRTYHITIIEK